MEKASICGAGVLLINHRVITENIKLQKYVKGGLLANWTSKRSLYCEMECFDLKKKMAGIFQMDQMQKQMYDGI